MLLSFFTVKIPGWENSEKQRRNGMKVYVVINESNDKVLATESVIKALAYVREHAYERCCLHTIKTEDFPVIDEPEADSVHAYSFVVNREDGEVISSQELAIKPGFLRCTLFNGKFIAYSNRPSVYDIWIIAKDYEEARKLVDFKYKHRDDLDYIIPAITGYTPKNSGRYPWDRLSKEEKV